MVDCKQVEDRGAPSKRVVSYLRNNQPAIPGSSLHGMVSSLAEALSQSSLRVLEDRDLVVIEQLYWGATRPLRAGSVYEYFRAIDPDLLPWKTPDRSHLTPAEILFGVVDERGDDDSGDVSTAPFHLASRVRFSDALPHPDRPPVVGAEVMLKVLASPKGRYPGIYFHPRDRRGTFIQKNRFYRANGRHNAGSLPNGRKVYLHHQAEDAAAERWVTVDPRRNAEQKLRCKPIRNEHYGESDSDLNGTRLR